MRTRYLNRWVRRYAPAAALSLLSGFAAADPPVRGGTESEAAPYARMAPLDEYLMDASAEVALARSAAPDAISAKATILTLRSQGYTTAAFGTNGFTCLVERSWMSPFNSPEFWNPKLRGPVCYNPAASASVLAYTLRRTELAVAGHSREKMSEEIRAALAHSELPAPQAGAMSFMMSKDQYLSDSGGHWHSHLMFHVPKVAASSWGANFPGSPVALDDRDVPEETVFLVPVAHWSDGTAAP
ncbi:MAG TPA: hypothetical protein VEC59_07775 [Steroidobacteraceae bacterium]|nr:hypothetical protein [Steroidobacteraceae bacterium]